METNFEIEDNYAIRINGRLIDLHNNFDFIGLTDNLENNSIQLTFSKSSGNWVQKNEYSEITFILSNLTYKHFIEADSVEFPEDARCLSDISFFPSDLREINDSITDQRKPNENDDLLFLFQDGKVIRVNCKKTEALIKE